MLPSARPPPHVPLYRSADRELTIDVVHGGAAGVVALDLIRPCRDRSQMALGLRRQDTT